MSLPNPAPVLSSDPVREITFAQAVNEAIAEEMRRDERVFVISDIQATIETLQGAQVVSFQGASEWALDSLVLSEALEEGPEGHYQSYTAESEGQPVGWICFGQTPCTVGTRGSAAPAGAAPCVSRRFTCAFTSCSVMRPLVPVPRTCARSTPSSRAKRRIDGLA